MTMNIPGLPDILISRARLEAQCERYGHDWFNQVGFGVFCRRCGAAPSNNGFHLTAAPMGLWDNEHDDGAAGFEPQPEDRPV
jgi:hypothetical protein